MTINAPEPITLSHLRDHALRVVEIRGKVIAYTRPFSKQPTKIRRTHIDRLQRVPAEMSWDDVAPRPHRSRSGPDVRTLPLTRAVPGHEPMPAADAKVITQEQGNHKEVHDPVKPKPAHGCKHADKKIKRLKKRRSRRLAALRKQQCMDTDSESTAQEDSREEPMPLSPAPAATGPAEPMHFSSTPAATRPTPEPTRTDPRKRTAETTDTEWFEEQPATHKLRERSIEREAAGSSEPSASSL